MKQAVEWLSLVASLLEREAYLERHQIIISSNPNTQATMPPRQYDSIVAKITERAQLFLRTTSMKIRYPPTIAMRPYLSLINVNSSTGSSSSSTSPQSQNVEIFGVRMNDTTKITFDMWQKGDSISVICTKRNLTPGTIHDHLERAILCSLPFGIADFERLGVDANKLDTIKEHLPPDLLTKAIQLKPIKLQLSLSTAAAAVTYDILKVAVAYYKIRQYLATNSATNNGNANAPTRPITNQRFSGKRTSSAANNDDDYNIKRTKFN